MMLQHIFFIQHLILSLMKMYIIQVEKKNGHIYDIEHYLNYCIVSMNYNCLLLFILVLNTACMLVIYPM